ncbi:phosphatase PAP2 family protein [Kaistia sp. 32K]|uniref:phosphatase PAP2 family protein n=1 Tax=Kaistia sp. 32K TaxID=2795690 RepID=UPI001914FD00|nr:phosphatase PAP2 family protein [Kaistia sp. 32K]
MERQALSGGDLAARHEAPTGRSTERRFWLAISLLAVISAIFVLFPALDIRVAALFYAGDDFPASRSPLLGALRGFGTNLVFVICVVLIASLATKLARPSRPMPIRASKVWYLLATLALGPGLIVNGVLKSLWGRPRPVQVDLFGGGAPFETAWKISGACHSNCSFSSGEAASAFWLLGLVLLAPPRHRRALAMAIGLVALALSLNRLAFGGHFLSDMLISWSLMLVVMLGLARVMLEEPFRSRIDAATESALLKVALASQPAFRRIARRWPSGQGSSSGLDRIGPST